MAVKMWAERQPQHEEAPTYHHQWWSPRLWLGCDFFGWMRLLARNRFHVGLGYIHIATIDTLCALGHTALRLVQELVYGRRVRATEIRQQPLFILGHWRCGTTLLHELLILDEKNTYPTTWECLEPNHFLLTEGWATKILGFLLPAKRPMDNMALGWDRPQEDEFALCNLGVPSPYLTIAFPNHPPQYPEYLDLEGLRPAALARWKQVFVTFLKQITLRTSKRIILKSPPHTCRIKVLIELFPDARFVYIVRDPYVVFPSTVHLWRSLYTTHGLQTPHFEGLDEHVLATFERMYDKFEETRDLIDPGRLFELRYEELVCDPVGQMAALYEALDLGDFARVQPAIEAYLNENQDYQTNRYRELSPELRDEITRRWAGYIEKYGYAPAHVS